MTEKEEKVIGERAEDLNKKQQQEVEDAKAYFDSTRKVPPGWRYSVRKGLYKAEGK